MKFSAITSNEINKKRGFTESREPSSFIKLLSRNDLGDGAASSLDLGLGRCAAGNLHRELLGEDSSKLSHLKHTDLNSRIRRL